MNYFVNANFKCTVIMHVAPHLSLFITAVPVSAEKESGTCRATYVLVLKSDH